MDSCKLRDLNENWQVYLDSQDIIAAREDCGIANTNSEDITGVAYNCQTGEYMFTDNKAPYNMSATYYKVGYWQ